MPSTRWFHTALVVCAAGLAVPAPMSSGAPSPSCLAIAFARWHPESPAWLPARWFTTPPHLRLLAVYQARAQRLPEFKGWRAIGPAPDLGSDTTWEIPSLIPNVPVVFGISDYLSVWHAPVPDSLEMRRLCFLSNCLDIAGKWRADTLRGGAHSYSDARELNEPKAVVVGVRYVCGSDSLAGRASAALASLIRREPTQESSRVPPNQRLLLSGS